MIDRGRVPVRPALVVVGAIALSLLLVLPPHSNFTDLRVYLQGASAFRHGVDPYAAGPGLPFTYPPVAAVLLAPLTLVPVDVALIAWTTASVCCLGWVVAHADGERGLTRRPAVLLAAVASMLLLEPVWRSVIYGQINLVLLALLLHDLSRLDRRGGGWLVGLCAALKLTPLVFVVFLMMIGRRGNARNAVVSFAGLTAAGWVLLPRSSWDYWTRLAWDPQRVGSVEFSGNQSLLAALSRLAGHPVPHLLWAPVAVVLGGALLVAARGRWLRGEQVPAAVLVGLTALLVSPVSWGHHWVWVVPGLVALAGRSTSRLQVVALAAVFGVFASRAIWHVPHGAGRELDWSPWQQVVGNAYVEVGLVVALFVIVAQVRRSVIRTSVSVRAVSTNPSRA